MWLKTLKKKKKQYNLNKGQIGINQHPIVPSNNDTENNTHNAVPKQ